MSVGAADTGTAADAGADGAAADAGASEEGGGSAAEILARLDAFSDPDAETEMVTDAVDKAKAADGAEADEAKVAKPDVEEDEDAKIIRELNRKSLERRRAKDAARRSAAAQAQTPAVAAATAAAKAADAAATVAKPATGVAKPAEQPNEVAQAVRDVLAQIERLAGDDAEAAKKAAAGTEDKGAETRAAELATIRATVEKIGEGLTETSALKTSVAELQKQLKEQADETRVRTIIADAIDRVAADVPLVASTARHEFTIKQNGVAKTVRMTGAEAVRYQAERFFEKYKVAPDLKELAKRIEKKLTPEKTGEKTPATRKTVSTDHSSPPASRQGPDKRSSKEAENDLYRRLGMTDEIRD